MKAPPIEPRSLTIADPAPIPPHPTGQIGLVIPCFRESKRLPLFLPGLCEALAAPGSPPVCVLPVDDGSGDAEADALSALVDGLRPHHPFLWPLLRLPVNHGKGGAVYAGWDHLAPGCRWLAFVDADGAVPPNEVTRFLALVSPLPERTALFAGRLALRPVDRSPTRRLAGLAFRGLVRCLFRLPVHDTQCGLKVVSSVCYAAVRPQLREHGFTFDVELAAALAGAGCTLREEPVEWHEKAGSHLRAPQALSMFLRLVALRLRRPIRPDAGPTTPRA